MAITTTTRAATTTVGAADVVTATTIASTVGHQASVVRGPLVGASTM
jgi:hypothetical protein